jgi:tRNA 5-methylaminomethyl-2-thiouridine biosynthesis bifunctional protein
MTDPEPDPRDADTPVIWAADGTPRSRRFGDVYFSSADGLAESQAVFLAGCGLPLAWAGRARFTVGELGFGSGLNILALLDLWRRTRPAGARLQVFSIEAFPMPAADARRVLAAWPEAAALAERLLSRWPRRTPGFHRLDFPELDASLDLAVMDVAEALEAWDGQADAWFLDGFSPACNPAMWSPAVFEALRRRSAPGARAATFTVAGEVRRGLAGAGFEVAKAPGFGRKRERLEARLPGAVAPGPDRPPRVAIVGGRIAGAALVRAFRALGATVEVLEAVPPDPKGPGNPAGLVMPRLDAGGGPVAQFYAQAMARAGDLYADHPQGLIARGALQLETGPKDAGRFDRIAASDLFTPGAIVRLSAAELGERLGEAAGAGGLDLTEALVVQPAAVLGDWLGGAVRTAKVARMARDGAAWRLFDPDDREVGEAEIVCLAAGLGCRALAPDAPLAPVRGQVSFLAAPERPAAAIGGGYLIPTRDGLLFGATHDRGDEASDVRAIDTRRNLDLLRRVRPALADALAEAPLQARAGVRAVTPDFLPLAGALGEPGLYILSGLGSRGLCAAPLLAEHVAAIALGAASPLPRSLSAIVDPGRFERRRQRRLGRPPAREASGAVK